MSTNNSCIPDKVYSRNEFGLIRNDEIKYVYEEDGTINWRKMVGPEFLVPHKQLFERTGKPIPTSIEGLADKELLILLSGIKKLATIRGLTKISYNVCSPTPEYVVAVCTIEWLPNYETENRIITSSGIGDASPINTTSFGKLYLAPIAENRAFVRCVRQFLRINVVSQEEIADMAVEAAEDAATTLLKETAIKYSISFETIKAKLIEENIDGAIGFNGFGDIPRFKQFELVERIKRKAAARETSSTQ